MSNAIKQSLPGNMVSTDALSRVDSYQSLKLTETQKTLKERVNKASLMSSIKKEKLNKKNYENLEGLMLTIFHSTQLVKKDSVEEKNTIPLRGLGSVSDVYQLTEDRPAIDRDGDYSGKIEKSVEEQNFYSEKSTNYSKKNKTEYSNFDTEKSLGLSNKDNDITKNNSKIDHLINKELPQSEDKIFTDSSLNSIKRKDDIESPLTERKASEVKSEISNSILKNIAMNQDDGRKTIKYKFSTWGSSHSVNIESSNIDTLLAYTSSDMVSMALQENQDRFNKTIYIYKDQDDNLNRKNSLYHSNLEVDSDSDD